MFIKKRKMTFEKKSWFFLGYELFIKSILMMCTWQRILIKAPLWKDNSNKIKQIMKKKPVVYIKKFNKNCSLEKN